MKVQGAIIALAIGAVVLTGCGSTQGTQPTSSSVTPTASSEAAGVSNTSEQQAECEKQLWILAAYDRKITDGNSSDWTINLLNIEASLGPAHAVAAKAYLESLQESDASAYRDRVFRKACEKASTDPVAAEERAYVARVAAKEAADAAVQAEADEYERQKAASAAASEAAEAAATPGPTIYCDQPGTECMEPGADGQIVDK